MYIGGAAQWLGWRSLDGGTFPDLRLIIWLACDHFVGKVSAMS